MIIGEDYDNVYFKLCNRANKTKYNNIFVTYNSFAYLYDK